MKIYINVKARSQYKKEIRKAGSKKHRPIQIISVCLLAISNFNILMNYYYYVKKHARNINSKRINKLLRAIVYDIKYSKAILDKIDEHKTYKDKHYEDCREFHPFRMGSWGGSLDKLVVLYKIMGFKCAKDVSSFNIELIRFGNHDF